jgi:hypothetical protein
VTSSCHHLRITDRLKIALQHVGSNLLRILPFTPQLLNRRLHCVIK